MSNKELLFFTSSISKMVHGQWRIHIRWFFSVWVVTKTLISSIGRSSFSIRHQQEQNCSLNNIIEFHVWLFSNFMQCCQLDFTKDLTSIKVLYYFVKNRVGNTDSNLKDFIFSQCLHLGRRYNYVWFRNGKTCGYIYSSM